MAVTAFLSTKSAIALKAVLLCCVPFGPSAQLFDLLFDGGEILIRNLTTLGAGLAQWVSRRPCAGFESDLHGFPFLSPCFPVYLHCFYPIKATHTHTKKSTFHIRLNSYISYLIAVLLDNIHKKTLITKVTTWEASRLESVTLSTLEF